MSDTKFTILALKFLLLYLAELYEGATVREATVPRVAKSRTRLKDFTFTFSL